MLFAAFVSAVAASPVTDFDFEATDGGFTPQIGELQWEWGTPTTGPGAAHTGSRVWATQLDGPYLNDAVGILTFPSYDLSPTASPSLVFWHWTEIQSGDAGWLEVSDGQGGWDRIEPSYGYPDSAGFTGSTGGWEQVYVGLDGLEDLSELRLVFSSDASVQGSGWYFDDLEVWDGDIAPPQVTVLSSPSDTEDLDGPYVVEVDATDDQGLDALELVWETPSDAGRAQMVFFTDRWAGGVSGQDPDTTVSWWVEASDGTNTTETEVDSFRVRLPPPTDLTGPTGRVVDVEVGLAWLPPTSEHLLESYRVYRDGELVAEPTLESVIVGVEGDGQDVFTVSAVFFEGEGDPSDELAVEVSKPRILDVDADFAWQGDRVRLDLVGEYLLLVDGEVFLDLGESISIESVEVVDVDRAEVLAHVAEDAEVGLRDLSLTSWGIDVVLVDGFEVLDGAGRPSVVAVEPDALRQGDQATLTITLSEAPASEELVIDAGPGVLVENISVDGSVLFVDVVVDPVAPIGLRALVVDDGERLLTGVEVRVRDALVAEPTCAHVDRHTFFGVALALFVLVVGRRERLE